MKNLVLLLKTVIYLAVFAMEYACAQPTTNAVSFEYLPEHTVGDIHVNMHARRFLEVAWKGHNLFTQGGEMFTRKYQPADLNSGWVSKGLLGFFRMNDTLPELNIPVRVERDSDTLIYTWLCDAFDQGYRQVNRAVIKSNRVSLTTTLSISTNVPLELIFHPVFFPGTEFGHNNGNSDPTMPGRSLLLVDVDKMVTSQVYPSNNPTNAWYDGNCASFSTQLPEGPVRMTIRSSNPQLRTTLYALARWPLSVYGGDRRGLVGHMSLQPSRRDRTLEWTYEIVVEVGDSATATTSPGNVLAPAEADFLKVTPLLSGRSFWFFHPNEIVTSNLQLDNRSSTNARVVQLACLVRNYSNAIIQQSSLPVALPSSGLIYQLFDFGSLDRGTYSIEFNAQSGSIIIGHAVVRVGVMPDHKVQDKVNCLGAFMAYTDNVDQQIDLMKWCGMGRARFRTEIHDERWPFFEPTAGKYATNLPSLKGAQKAVVNGISLVFSGEHFPPQLPTPAWLATNQINLFYYNSRVAKTGYMPQDSSLFSSYVQEWASRYIGLIYCFSVFNEPDIKMDPTDAARIIQLVSANIKAVIPSAEIAACDVMDLSPASIKWLDQVMNLASNDVDIITYHQYKTGWYKRTVDSRFPVIEHDGWESDLQQIAALGKRYGKPVWNGEISWVGCPSELFPHKIFKPEERDTANIQIRSYLLTKASGIESIIQCFTPALRSPDYSYTIYPERAASPVGWGWMVKPWAVAHATLSELLDMAKFIERVDLGDSKTYILCFEQPNRRFATAWRSRGTVTVSIPFESSEVTLRSIVGQSLTQQKVVTLTESPIYIISDSFSREDFMQRVRTSRIVTQPDSPPNLRLIPK
jgi:hypothetical protein